MAWHGTVGPAWQDAVHISGWHGTVGPAWLATGRLAWHMVLRAGLSQEAHALHVPRVERLFCLAL